MLFVPVVGLFDQVGYWALRIVSGVPDAIPMVGSTVVDIIRGGASVGQSTLTRFYSLHTFVLPVSLTILDPFLNDSEARHFWSILIILDCRCICYRMAVLLITDCIHL